jgi:type 1 glutamine amidotransferase
MLGLAVLAPAVRGDEVAGQERKILVITGADPGKFHPWEKNLELIRERLAVFGVTKPEMLVCKDAAEWRANWRGNYADYAAVLIIYWWEQGPEEELAKLDAYVRNGGGLVLAHSTLAGFQNQKIFDEWTGFAYREHKPDYGSNLVFDADGKRIVRAPGEGKGSYHEPIRPFVIQTHDAAHPIMAGLPEKWLQAPDELYLFLRGPDPNRHVIATAQAPDGTFAPQAWVRDHGKGRIFCLTPGHHAPAASSVGFITLLARGLEWAATGKVTSKVPVNFPSETESVTDLPRWGR